MRALLGLGDDDEMLAEDDPARLEIRTWLATHPSPTGRQLAAAGYVAPHWPAPYGLDADPALQVAIDAELARAGVERPDNQIGIGWAGPTILAAGTEAQKQRFLPPLLDGSEFWCQLFSEPGSGSDLSSLSTAAVLDGDTWVVSGQKVWTTWADRSRWGILLARTDPDLPKHRGISFFICPMDDPGVDVRPIREMSGGHHFCEVFLDQVRVPTDHMIGSRGDGWRLANVTLANERVALSTGGVCWGMGPTSQDFMDLVRRQGGIADPLLRQRCARVFTEAIVLDLLGQRMLSTAIAGGTPGPEASMKKFLADVHGQHLTELAADLAGSAALLADDDAVGPLGADAGEWPWAFRFARALTVGGGTSQVQRNILAERVLGLPREPDPTAGPPWRETGGSGR
jgi:alkylation response protein AidB-like acyl-CoA dehydrogenase